MSTPKHRKTSQQTTPATTLPKLTFLTVPGEALLADLAKTYIAGPGTALHDIPCVICLAPLRSEPFTLHVMIYLDGCPDGGGHLLAGAAARHTGCSPYDDDHLNRAVYHALNHIDAG